MFNTHPALLAAAVWITSVLLLPSCVGTELVAHGDHPGNPNARSGKLPATVGLLSDFNAGSDRPAAMGVPSADPASAKDDGAVRYTCPMHPEIVQGEPGSCPKCGMKLVPKAKDPK
jgi:hypothetical protein